MTEELFDPESTGGKACRAHALFACTHCAFNEIARLRTENTALAGRVEGTEKAKNGAYSERNRLVAALSKVFPSFLGRHDKPDWEDDWRWIVFVMLPTGQASWHIHDSELGMFDHLERRNENPWDGHTNDEKWRRVAALPPTPAEQEIAAMRENYDKARALLQAIADGALSERPPTEQLVAIRSGAQRFFSELSHLAKTRGEA